MYNIRICRSASQTTIIEYLTSNNIKLLHVHLQPRHVWCGCCHHVTWSETTRGRGRLSLCWHCATAAAPASWPTTLTLATRSYGVIPKLYFVMVWTHEGWCFQSNEALSFIITPTNPPCTISLILSSSHIILAIFRNTNQSWAKCPRQGVIKK